MKFIFCMQINIKVFCKATLSFKVSVTRHAQTTQNKFAYLCNISIKACWMKLVLLPADRDKSFLQDYSITLGVGSQTGPKYQKQPNYNISAMSQGKHEFDFLRADKR